MYHLVLVRYMTNVVHWPCMVHITMQPWTANLDRNLYPLARNGGCTNNNELAQFSVVGIMDKRKKYRLEKIIVK